MGRNEQSRASARERLEGLAEWVEDLQYASEDGAMVVVEGDKDVEALRELGFRGPLERCSRSFLQGLCGDLARLVPGARVVVLTDWDRKGEQLARLLADYLGGEGLASDLEFRRRLRALVMGEVKDVESLPSMRARLAREARPRDYI